MNDAFDEARVGAPGIEWMRQRGWLLSSYFAPFQVYAKEIVADQSVIRRAYFTPIRAEYSTPSPSSHATLDLLFVVSGRAAVTPKGQEGFVVEAGDIVACREGMTLHLESKVTVALLQVRVGEKLFPFVTTVEGVQRLTPDEGPASVFGTLLTSIFEADLRASDPGYRHMEAAIAALFSTLLPLDPLDGAEGTTPAEAAILERARSFVQRHAADPDLTVQDIAVAANVSRSYLYRVFARAGSSPQRYLTQVRSARARLDLSRLENPRPLAVQETARRNGFASARAMRRALSLE